MQGIVVGSDQTQEWILPWWWKRYAKCNSLPVVFIDFGMSENAKKWCRERGELLTIPLTPSPRPKEKVSQKNRMLWTSQYDERIWIARNSWFQKPRALLHSPFAESNWLDLDCEVLGNLSPLFEFSPFGAALDGREGINTGVLIFKKAHPLLQRWAEFSAANTHQFAGDQDALNALLKTENIRLLSKPALDAESDDFSADFCSKAGGIAERLDEDLWSKSCQKARFMRQMRFRKKSIKIIPQIYNWRASLGSNPDARIIHWQGSFGKEMIGLALSLERDLLSFGVLPQQ